MCEATFTHFEQLTRFHKVRNPKRAVTREAEEDWGRKLIRVWCQVRADHCAAAGVASVWVFNNPRGRLFVPTVTHS